MGARWAGGWAGQGGLAPAALSTHPSWELGSGRPTHAAAAPRSVHLPPCPPPSPAACGACQSRPGATPSDPLRRPPTTVSTESRWELSAEDMAALDGLDEGLVTGWDPIKDAPV